MSKFPKNHIILFGMKILCVIILCQFALSSCASLKPHPRPWTSDEKKYGAFLVLGIMADAYTTERFLNDSQHRELNPALGEHPNDLALAIYFSLSGLIILGLSYCYPKLRKPFLLGYGGLSFGAAIHNYNLNN